MHQSHSAGPATDGLAAVGRAVLVLSGKGGVGKSTVAVNIAAALRDAGRRVGVLDIDLHGPSVPTMLGCEQASVGTDGQHVIPVAIAGLQVLSIGFLLREQDDAVIWRGPRKAAVIRQFLHEAAWGELDDLVIDLPPGTGDEALAVVQELGCAAGAVVVTAPQRVAEVDVRKSIRFCRELNLPVLGIIENFSGFACPDCGMVTAIFGSGAGARIAADAQVPFLGSIPIDCAVAGSGDAGRPYLTPDAMTETARSFRMAVAPLLTGPVSNTPESTENPTMTQRIAIPCADGVLCMHFGHCQEFALVDVADGAITGVDRVTPPPHEPGVLPRWLAGQGVTTIIAGGMGQRAQDLFARGGISVITGAAPDTPEQIVTAHLAGALVTGANACDH
ncbi:MAG: iron-sulfur cluster carrier protein MrpORP [Planctomycetota bacterium]